MSKEIQNFTPREIVSELDQFIIGQDKAKRAVAIAMRNRWRRQQLDDEMKNEIVPKNIIMIGPTGVGKTEIARRLAKLTHAPFIKVEASKFTEVGYVGKDVESMIRELTETSVSMVKEEEKLNLRKKAEEYAEERLLDILIPSKLKPTPKSEEAFSFDIENINDVFKMVDNDSKEDDRKADKKETQKPEESKEQEKAQKEAHQKTREKMREMLRKGKLDNRTVELNLNPPKPSGMPMIEVVSAGGSMDEIGKNIRDMFSSMMPGNKKRKKVSIPEALDLLAEEEVAKLIEMDDVVKKAIERVEQGGIVFIDEIDKIASNSEGGGGGRGPDISRQGVQRDILPIVEGSRVQTKYGAVNTDHILFVAAGAFHLSKPSDLIPELQGRFPVRVELDSLGEEDFLKILKEPQNSLTKQYKALLGTEKIDLELPEEGLKAMAHFAAMANEQMENIGARRLHTIFERVLDEILFDAPEKQGERFTLSEEYVKKAVQDIIKNEDLSNYIL